MARAVVWDNNTPVNGVDPNNTEDDITRFIRLGIHERMDDVVVDWTADPVVMPQIVDALRLVKRYKYDADQAAGSRATNPFYAQAMLVIDFQGNTDASSNIFINFNEFGEVYNLTDGILNFLVGAANAPIMQALYQTSANDFVFAFPISVNVGTRVITYSVRRADGGLIGNAQFVTGDMTFFLQNIPT